MNHFGSYEVVCALKSGGMGDVLLGRRTGPGMFEQMVAIKTIRSQLAGAEVVRAHFLDEAAILAKVNHGAVAGVHDFGEQDGTLYMVMEYVAGISFRDLLDMKPPATVIAQAVAEACRGLHAAHELKDLHGNPMGVVHRDISPDNLILGFDGHVKVIDFGIALIRNRQAPATEFGSLKGKPAYMSPEQLKNGAVDRRADVFAIGVVLWELLTGQALFEGDSLYAIAYAVDNQSIAPPSQIAGPLPAGLDATVLNALSREAATRTRSAAVLAEQLTEIVGSAGEESLEAWAEVHLAAHREDHRRWLSKALTKAADSALSAPPAVSAGRRITPGVASDTNPGASNAFAQTEIGDGGLTSDSQIAPSGAQNATRPPQVATDVAMFPLGQPSQPTGTTGNLPWRGIAAGAVLLIASLGGYLLVKRSTATESNPPIAQNAMIDATVNRPDAAAQPPDAAMPADAGPAPVDAAVNIDARTKKDDSKSRRDQPVRPQPTIPDATPVVPVKITSPEPRPVVASGMGTLRIKASTFANVLIDGKPFGDAPLKKKIAAGTYKVEIIAPDTGAVRLAKTITIVDGQEITLNVQ